MKTFDLTNIDEGNYVVVKSNGATLLLWVKDGAVTEVSIHNETPQVNIFTTSKMTKKTQSVPMSPNDCITLKVKE